MTHMNIDQADQGPKYDWFIKGLTKSIKVGKESQIIKVQQDDEKCLTGKHKEMVFTKRMQ